MKRQRVTVLWLIPAEPERELFLKIIRILAAEFDAPRFEPHLTLGQAREGDSPRKILQAIPFQKIKLRIGGVAFSAKFTRTLFIRFKPNRVLEKLVGVLARDRKSLRDPHLSLIYKRLPAATKRELAATIKPRFRQVTFDLVKVVECVSPSETAGDVRSWRVMASKRLSG